MCNPLFYDLRVILSANVSQVVCFTDTIVTTEAAD